MGELLDYIKDRYSKQDRSVTQDMMERTKVKNAICDTCDAHLTEAGTEFQFEVASKDLPHAVSVILEEPLRSKYDIVQISPTIFSARLKEIEL